MLRFSVSRFSIPVWAPLLLFLTFSFIGITHTALGTHSLRVQSPQPLESSSPSKPSQSAAPVHDGPLAKQVFASDLLRRPLTNNTSTIPKIFHQSWMSSELPAKFQRWSDACRALHADWEWVLWTDEDNEFLVRKHFPWLLESYMNLPAEIYRADFARSLYMYAYGGLYNDLDTDCLQPSEVVLDKYFSSSNSRPSAQSSQLAFFGRMGDNPGFEHSIPNAWMAATPGHPLFLVHMESVDRRVRKGDKAGPESLTGPISLRDAIVDYEVGKVKHGYSISDKVDEIKEKCPYANLPWRDHQVVLLPSEIIYPYSWGGDGEPVRDVCWVLKSSFDPDECKERLEVKKKGSISITYWSHTHSPSGKNTENMKHID